VQVSAANSAEDDFNLHLEVTALRLGDLLHAYRLPDPGAYFMIAFIVGWMTFRSASKSAGFILVPF